MVLGSHSEILAAAQHRGNFPRQFVLVETKVSDGSTPHNVSFRFDASSILQQGDPTWRKEIRAFASITFQINMINRSFGVVYINMEARICH